MKCVNCYDSVSTMLADKLKVIETMSDEIQTLRAKVASADVLVDALREIKDVVGKYASDESEEGWIFIDAYKKIENSLANYDKLSEVKHE